LNTMVSLAAVFSLQSKFEEALKLREEVLAIQCRVLGSTHPDTVASMNRLAWMLATCKGSNVRDGQRAVQLAEEVAAATSRAKANYMDTLAAAYAEVGDFPKAISVQQECLALPDPEHFREGYEARLLLYQSGSPFRQEPFFGRSRRARDSAPYLKVDGEVPHLSSASFPSVKPPPSGPFIRGHPSSVPLPPGLRRRGPRLKTFLKFPVQTVPDFRLKRLERPKPAV
jgi:hypothetical protein